MITALRDNLNEFLDDTSVQFMFINGPSGGGKTVFAKKLWMIY